MTDVVSALDRLKAALGGTDLPLELPGVERQRRARAEILGQLDDYVLPRLRQVEAPLLAVVGGSTGAGKSTLVNSLVGQQVSAPGVLRPTTRSPVLLYHREDEGWFAGPRILPDLARTDAATADPRSLQLVPVPTMRRGVAILDAPDIDSVESANRTLASQLLAAADLWLFVTTAARYADQVPWDFLNAAAERSAAVAVILDRVAPEARDEVSSHLQEMLTERGLADSPLFVVEEAPLDERGLLPAAQVAGVLDWLEALAADSDARASLVRRTLSGAVGSVVATSRSLATAHSAQVDMVARLRGDAHAAYAEAVREVGEASADGTLLRGEVLARWQEFVGTGELFRALESRVGWLRDQVGGWLRGKPAGAERVTAAVESGLESLLVEHAETAAERTWRSWASLEAGKRLLEGADRDLGRASREFRREAERAVRDWQHAVLEMVRTEGADRRKTARFLAFGFNGLSVALMIVVFASTAGVTGAEVGIAGGSAVLGQKLLEAVFGDQAVRRLAEQARAELEERVVDLYAGESARFTHLLEGLGLEPDDSAELQEAADAVGALTDGASWIPTDPGGPA